tara:strand:- start:309 stop:551 length:243 start_codon:yes stop_codon:yes gene_type:complete
MRISIRKNRISKTEIEVWDNRDESLANHDGDENWYTLCHDHASLVSHQTRKLAEYHAVVPEWCEGCLPTVIKYVKKHGWT